METYNTKFMVPARKPFTVDAKDTKDAEKKAKKGLYETKVMKGETPKEKKAKLIEKSDK